LEYTLTQELLLVSMSMIWMVSYPKQQYNRQVVLCRALGLEWQGQGSTWGGYSEILISDLYGEGEPPQQVPQ